MLYWVRQTFWNTSTSVTTLIKRDGAFFKNKIILCNIFQFVKIKMFVQVLSKNDDDSFEMGLGSCTCKYGTRFRWWTLRTSLTTFTYSITVWTLQNVFISILNLRQYNWLCDKRNQQLDLYETNTQIWYDRWQKNIESCLEY